MNSDRGKKVFVGMSGGVDSSLSAALLQKQGYNVTGVFIKAWHPDFLPCTWKEDRRDAMRVCAHLGIPFITLDLEKEYKQSVVDYMISEYKEGRTPNPDVMCNKEIKFGAFYKEAMRCGADFVATGHYAQVEKEGGKARLVRGADFEKDQTYFLWALPQETLSHTLFPVGHLRKKEVRKEAQKYNLPVFDKKDSQGLCFLGQVDMKAYLSHELKPEKGEVLDEEGNVIGVHDGALLYTLGERHGFIVHHQSPDSEPLYVIQKDLEKNSITVAPKKELHAPKAGVHSITLKDVNWISDIPKEGVVYDVQFRYRQKPLTGTIYCAQGGIFTVCIDEPQVDIASGQSLVVYDGAVCMGGGIIEHTK